jgi:quercetin dioxygenase-like cupin family protein
MTGRAPGLISLETVAASIEEPWTPTDVTAVNDAVIRMVRLRGDFPWHHHDEDELFLCWSGTFRIEIEYRHAITLSAGELFVVPRGVRHRPVADQDAVALLMERPETKQYGS